MEIKFDHKIKKELSYMDLYNKFHGVYLNIKEVN